MNINPKIFGAVVVGAGLLGFAFIFSDFGAPAPAADPAVAVVAAAAPPRAAIEVLDENGNGTPDWREELRITEPVRLDTSTTTNYTAPETLTGQLAIGLLEETIRAQSHGSLGKSSEEILAGASAKLLRKAADELYYEKHITISEDTDLGALHAYGNRVAEITVIHATPEQVQNEAVTLKRALDESDASQLSDLALIADSYEHMRDDMLKAPVPASLVKEHLDLINVYNALLIDIKAMQLAFEDPLYTMARLKRYQEDALGLHSALINLYGKLHGEGVRFVVGDIATTLITVND